MNVKKTWSTQRVPGQAGLYREAVSPPPPQNSGSEKSGFLVLCLGRVGVFWFVFVGAVVHGQWLILIPNLF